MPPTHSLPSTTEIVAAIALADCNLYLAAERLARQYRTDPQEETNPAITPTSLLSTLTQDPESIHQLTQHLRIRTLLSAYTTMTTLSLIITASLTEYEPKDQVRVFQAYSTLFAQLASERPTFGNTNQINLNTQVNMFDRVLAMLPPDVREAVQHLAPATEEPTEEPTLISRRRLRLQGAQEQA